MPALRFGSIELPLRPETVRVTPIEVGDTSRAVDGSIRTSRRAVKRQWALETAWLSQDDAAAWRGLLMGRGHYFPFDSSTASAGGLTPSASALATISTSTKRAGAGSLELGATTGSCTFSGALGATYSLGYWRYNGTVWEHWGMRSDGARFYLGARNDSAAMNGLDTTVIAAGSYRFIVGASAVRNIDDAWCVPYIVPASWLASIAVNPTVAHPFGPWLSISGDIVSGSTLDAPATVGTQVTGVKFGQGSVGSEYESAMQSLAVTLQEV